MPPSDAAELAVVAGGLAGVEQLAALVEEVAHGDRQVLLALGHRRGRATSAPKCR